MDKVARPLRAIRLKCYDCSGFNWNEVANCTHTTCILWPLRYGRKPKNAAYSKNVGSAEYVKTLQGA